MKSYWHFIMALIVIGLGSSSSWAADYTKCAQYINSENHPLFPFTMRSSGELVFNPDWPRSDVPYVLSKDGSNIQVTNKNNGHLLASVESRKTGFLITSEFSQGSRFESYFKVVNGECIAQSTVQKLDDGSNNLIWDVELCRDLIDLTKNTKYDECVQLGEKINDILRYHAKKYPGNFDIQRQKNERHFFNLITNTASCDGLDPFYPLLPKTNFSSVLPDKTGSR